MSDMIKIVCPVCGAEYTPSEIYLPNSFFGKPSEVVKTTNGKIDYLYGPNADMDLEEDYVCDYCNTKMHIKANLGFKVTNIDDDFVININKSKKLKLLEEGSLFGNNKRREGKKISIQN